ncbi:hypothetical protein DM194_13095 (plasmid) [Azospirillum ramasamyi]|uniref:Uncharacterized protein n=1 Tax=Azospirillum ramasamyi TaxID=682998 RepID=A0A2U9SC69_9PROT|nr:hypothetical protein DM194_13095 [Azospirillum ramasamyi]
MAAAGGVSVGRVQRIWRAHGLQPRRRQLAGWFTSMPRTHRMSFTTNHGCPSMVTTRILLEWNSKEITLVVRSLRTK